MDAIGSIKKMAKDRNDQIEDTVKRTRGRLFNFIRKNVGDAEAEDILQDVFTQFVVGYDEIRSIEGVSSWLFTTARNRITDLFRKKKPIPFSDRKIDQNDGQDGPLTLEDILPDLSSMPDQEYFRSVIWEAVNEALDELPTEQRNVFVWHELEDQSFKEISVKTGETVNTLLSRKRYAVLHLRNKLQELYNEID
jgi:RNA polymerase sigma factor (sigma-70 family)